MEIYRQRKNEIEFYPRNLMKVFLKKIWLIILCMILGGSAAYSFTSFFIENQYSTSVTLYVNNSSLSSGSETITTNDLSVSESLVDAYAVIITSNTVMEQVINESGVDLNASQLAGMISVEAQNETSLFKVFVTDTDPIRGANIANIVAKVVTNQITNIIEGSSVKIIDEAKIAEQPVSPNYKLNVMIGALLGLFISVSIIFIRAIMRDHFVTAENLEEWGYPILGNIPEFSGTMSKAMKR